MLMGNDRLIYIARNKFPGVPIHGKAGPYYSLLTTDLLTTCYSHCSLLTTHYSLLTTHYSTHYSRLTNHCSPLTTIHGKAGNINNCLKFHIFAKKVPRDNDIIMIFDADMKARPYSPCLTLTLTLTQTQTQTQTPSQTPSQTSGQAQTQTQTQT